MIVVVLVLGTLDISDNDIYSCSEVIYSFEFSNFYFYKQIFY